MNSIELILLNFSETRRRSIKLWQGIPFEYLHWKPDEGAMSIIEMVRHVLEGEHLYHKIIENQGDLGNYQSPWNGLPYTDLKAELEFASKYRALFLEMISTLKISDLKVTWIKRTEVGQCRRLGGYLNRIAYHEAVHTGQLLAYIRAIGIDRPNVWD